MRLNPNVPTKTRGNAALVARFGHGRGPTEVAGSLPEGPVTCYRTGRELTDRERISLAEKLWTTVQRTSAGADPGTDPALVLVRRRPRAELYWNAVRRVVTREEVDRWLRGTGAIVRSVPSGLGVIGAAAALAWPGAHPTWEAIAYRGSDRWGLPREIDVESVRRAVRRHPELFLCLDPRTRRLLIAPHTACPILFGVRATSARTAAEALREIHSEPVDRWLLFRTNQGTGDHIRRPWTLPPVPFTTGTVTGTLAGPPMVQAGGHVLFSLETNTGGTVRCVVFEPTKTLPRVVQSLTAGDRVRVWGGSQDDPLFRVEGIDLVWLGSRELRESNPRCPFCAHRMGSLGSGRGFRCTQCRHRVPPESRGIRRVPPMFPAGRYHPTPSARRHLAPRGPEPRIPRRSMG